ncbi:gluconokinase [Bifidobacterium asteroides]|uniref:Gluconokinase n=1 Tax=Bifidobacterium asteroides TaxID=1684 RepID=A0ABS3IXY6_9BIFI|nr:gluconokinase [Bifidobacterium asteroides]MCP8614203.1 gluconokinase [Bifidobacterium asteroides]
MVVHVVIMGVAGCGKTTTGEAVSNRLGFVMAEGDDFHSQANIEKMSRGIPLTDEDRWPWLRAINRWMIRCDTQGKSTVVSCSALKRAYRDILRNDVPVLFVHLSGSLQLIADRLAKRTGHYMPASLLPSQFADLEPLEADETGSTVSIDGTADEVADHVVDVIDEYRRVSEGTDADRKH